ncbi:general substrate transporter [Mycena galericulata]|nr:general substrate transporter [Mycena galericulata]
MAGGPAVAHSTDNAYTHLMDPNRKWYNNRRIIVLNAWIVLLLITSSTNGYDGSMMNGLQSLTQWETYFDHPANGKLGLLNAIQNIGGLAGYPFAPYFSDGIGRRPTVFIGALIMVIATAVQTASQSVGMFIGARFLIGFGLTFAANAAPMLVTELSYPKYRAPLTSTYNSLWYSGAIVAAWATFGTFKIHNTWSWRVPSLLQALPSILQVCFVLFAPESPRYLVSKGKEAEALHILAYYHADGNEDDPLVKYELEEIKAAIEFDRTVAANVGWKSFLSTPGNRKRVRIIVAIAFFSQWSGNGLVSYYLNKVLASVGITDPTIQLLINGILQIWNLAWALTASSMVERFGRRLMFLTSVAGMLLFFTLQTICTARFQIDGSTSAAHAVIAFIFLYYASYDIAFTPLIVTYTLEILPYNIRAKGFNIFNFTISLALIFNQYVNPIALGHIHWKYYIVYCAWLAFEGVFLYFYVIETKNRTLEETAAIFDGVEATDEIVANAAAQAGVKHDLDPEHKHEERMDEKASTAS